MKKLFLTTFEFLLLVLFMSFILLGTSTRTAYAGVAGYDSGSYKGVFSAINCDKGVVCVKAGQQLKLRTDLVQTALTFTAADASPSVAGGVFFNTDTASLTITALDDGTKGQEVVIVSKGAVTYDVTSTTLKCGTTDVITAANDVTRWVFDGTDWLCLARVKASGNMN